jgi:lysine-specific demethylase 8
MTGAGDRSTVVASWTLADLAARFGSIKVPVRDYDDEHKQFFAGGAGGMRRRKMMGLAEYIRLIDANESAGSGGSRNGQLPYAGNISIRDDPAVAGKFATLLEECRFPDWLPGNSRDEYRLWIGAVGQRSTIHNDPYHNFNAQIIGGKRFLLFAPEQHDKLYPNFFHAAMWASPVDPDAPDLAQYPRFADVRGYECELQEGEILFIPRFWWHCVAARKVSVNVNRWVFSDDGRWHQQPEARRFISYRQLLEDVKAQFDAQPSFLQEFQRDEFEKLSAELQALSAVAVN